MVAEPPRSQRRLFPEIRVQLGIAGRRAGFLLPPAAQIAVILVILAGVAAVAWLAADWISYDRLAAGQQAAMVRAAAANADLQDQMGALRDRLALTREAREAARQRLAALAERAKSLNAELAATETKLAALQAMRQHQSTASQEAASSKAGSIAEATVALDRAQRQLHQIEAARAVLIARISKTEADRRAAEARAADYQAEITAAQKKLQRLGAKVQSGKRKHR